MIKKFQGEDFITNWELAYKINEIIDSVNKIQEFIEKGKIVIEIPEEKNEVLENIYCKINGGN